MSKTSDNFFKALTAMCVLVIDLGQGHMKIIINSTLIYKKYYSFFDISI